MRIKELPILERPREKALRYGVESLANHELLAVIINEGVRDKSAIDIAYELYYSSGTLNTLFKRDFQSLKNASGIDKAIAIRLLACFELGKRFKNEKEDENIYLKTSKEVFNQYQKHFLNVTQEKLFVVVLNRQRKILSEHLVAVGNENEIVCSKQEILKCVIQNLGTHFYIIHNHPNAPSTPSPADELFVKKLIDASKSLGIRLIDSIVVGNDGYSTMLEKNEKSYCIKL